MNRYSGQSYNTSFPLKKNYLVGDTSLLIPQQNLSTPTKWSRVIVVLPYSLHKLVLNTPVSHIGENKLVRPLQKNDLIHQTAKPGAVVKNPQAVEDVRLTLVMSEKSLRQES